MVPNALNVELVQPVTHNSVGEETRLACKRNRSLVLRHAHYPTTLNAVRNRAEWRDRYRYLLDRSWAKEEALTILASLPQGDLSCAPHRHVHDPLALTPPKPCSARAGLGIQSELFFLSRLEGRHENHEHSLWYNELERRRRN